MLDADQQIVVSDQDGARSVIAGPGAGKTTTMVALIQALLVSGVSPSDIKAVTFSKEMALALEKKLKVKGVVSTFHSLGYLICSETERKPVEPELRYRLMIKLVRKYHLEYKELDGFIAKMRRENITPEEIEDHRGGYDYGLVCGYVEYELVRLHEGWMDFDSMLADAVQLLEIAQKRARWQARYLIVDEAQDTDNCQPAGTLVRKVIGTESRNWTRSRKVQTEDVPIETLKNGDRVVAWARRHAKLTKQTDPISISVRQYCGSLRAVSCGTNTTRMTPDHRVYAIMNGENEGLFLVYLMYRADRGFRVGQCALRYCKNTKHKPMGGLGSRFTEERAERGWILRVCATRAESRIWEQIYAVQYGLPYITFDHPSAPLVFLFSPNRGRTCLVDSRLLFDSPLYAREENGNKKGPFKRYFETAAANLIPEIMSLPGTEPFTQTRIDMIIDIPHEGPVYSLNIPKHHTYVADGLVVKNCQWRMMQLMSEKYGNITVVGDPNQCIYSFRGAKPENITNFQKWFPQGRHLYLGRNYRSTRKIVAFVRENAPPDTPKELLNRMVATRDGEGDPITLKMYWTDDEEAESALKLSQKDPLNSIILARTNRMVGLLERLCNRYNIRYHLMGKTGYWKQNEIRKAVESMKDYFTMTTEGAMNLTLPRLEAKYAVDDRTERDNDALENLRTLRIIGKDFRMAKDFVVYANKMMHRRNDPHGVSISTVHQAKGGEWKNVYLIGTSAKGFPHPKGDPQEERRIYFVAISRAIDTLRISFSGTPSPYLRKYLTEEILDQLREKAAEVDRLQAQTKLFS